jgi:hypothetical protein
MRGKLATVIDQIEHGHHVFRAYFNHAFLKQYEKFFGDQGAKSEAALCHRHAWILEPSATGLCGPDLHVFAKLFEDCPKRGLEAQAFSGREIGGNDDVLDFLVRHFVDVDLTGQPAS